MNRVVHIERKNRSLDLQVSVLERALRGHEGRELTPADAVALSGIPLDVAEQALLQLAARTTARVRVTEKGDLLFRFTALTPRRSKARWQDLARLWRVADRRVFGPLLALVSLVLLVPTVALFFGNALAVPVTSSDTGWLWLTGIPSLVALLVTGLAFVFVMLAFVVLPLMAVAGIAGAIGMIAVLVEAWPPTVLGAIGCLATAAMLLAIGVPAFRYSVLGFRKLALGEQAAVRRFWILYGGLLFGPRAPAQARDALVDERRLTSLIRARAGILCASDLVGLFRWTPEEAERGLVRILVDYGGDLHVTDDGAIVYVFAEMRRTADAADLAEPAPLPIAAAPRWLSADPSMRAAAILLLAVSGWGALGVALLTGIVADAPLFPTAADLARNAGRTIAKFDVAVLYGLGLWPHVAICGLPIVRLPRFLWRRHAWRRRRTLDRHLAIAASQPEGAPLVNPDPDLAARLGGEFVGPDRIRFPDLARSFRAAQRLRCAPMARPDLGPVVYSSDDVPEG